MPNIFFLKEVEGEGGGRETYFAFSNNQIGDLKFYAEWSAAN